MARSRGFSRAPRRSSGVARDWGLGPGESVITSIMGTGSTILGSGITPGESELTVMRTRGLLELGILGQATANGDGFFGAVGIGVFSLPAFTAGVTSMPTPVTEAAWNGWFWHQFIALHDWDVGVESQVSIQYEVDSKAMRKFDTQMVLAAVIEVTEIGAATMGVFFDSRMLFQDSGR